MADFTPTQILDTPVVLDPTNVASEVQKVVVTAEGGTFALKFGGKETAAIKFNATQAEVEAALTALTTLQAGDVQVTGGPGSASGGSPYVIAFGNGLEDKDVSQVEAIATNLTGTTHTAVASTTTSGVGPANAVIRGTGAADATEREGARAGKSPAQLRAEHASEFGD